MDSPVARPDPILRWGLVILGIPNLLNGFHALLDPRGWFDFYGVGGLGGFNDHLVRDLGEAFIATSALLLLAALWLDRRVIYAALTTWLIFNVPHLVNHLFERDQATDKDYYGAIVALTFNVAVALFIFVRARRRTT